MSDYTTKPQNGSGAGFFGKVQPHQSDMTRPNPAPIITPGTSRACDGFLSRRCGVSGLFCPYCGADIVDPPEGIAWCDECDHPVEKPVTWDKLEPQHKEV